MKNRIITLIALMTLALWGMAQNATGVLDKTANKLKNSGGIEASFEATSFQGTTEKGKTTGTICVKGNKFKVNSPSGQIWFDGQTQWSLYANSDEVNVSNPTEKELQSINPYTFVDLYKQGFKHSMTNITYNGKPCYKVQMTPQKQSHIQEMLIVIDKKTALPYSIRIKQNNNWFQIKILNLKTGNKWNDSFFKFNPKDFPDVDVIDLR